MFFVLFCFDFAYRQILCKWRENALSLICEAKATAQAEAHYRRVILSKVCSVLQIPRSV